MSLCWLVQVKYTNKPKTSIPATMEGSTQLQPRFPPPHQYLGSGWLSRGWQLGSAGVLQCLGSVSGRPKWGCALSERASGAPRELSAKPKGETWEGLLGTQLLCWHTGLVLRNAHSSQGRSQPWIWTPWCARSRWVNEPNCSLLSQGIPASLHWAGSSSMAIESWKRDNFLITTRKTDTNYPHSPATLIRQTYKWPCYFLPWLIAASDLTSLPINSWPVSVRQFHPRDTSEKT